MGGAARRVARNEPPRSATLREIYRANCSGGGGDGSFHDVRVYTFGAGRRLVTVVRIHVFNAERRTMTLRSSGGASMEPRSYSAFSRNRRIQSPFIAHRYVGWGVARVSPPPPALRGFQRGSPPDDFSSPRRDTSPHPGHGTRLLGLASVALPP